MLTVDWRQTVSSVVNPSRWASKSSDFLSVFNIYKLFFDRKRHPF
ncbi:hypothetical protein YPPY13_2654 [Yersinia pestis PY-13]|nr:conserved hypothetical protein [Yersinia pestis KIM D27]EIQ87872.1 hypothetical protein YPPY01_2567 [Yersinia pestis PY-01]EIQ89309.1 hypothetical protein YPPY02_2603 [Yersinia pestis PY-02]EIQ90104.1 hypothetical protein YPPY03_2662 [Yersinia pestis PY-03]EIR03070.1 hypothetical protein YPPY05_2604 [Yersinia pestis PY-05]EIR17942.1 hypothetical protein YPPY08_2644 [Yersinia pestis PY-08]EIR19930.1 hypothetical protein YPPY09_2665 [Yersinia pestis PY-09]EIR33009.1 hypothetical protein YPP